jgi:glycerol-3-phosphate responsive antiterminator
MPDAIEAVPGRVIPTVVDRASRASSSATN